MSLELNALIVGGINVGKTSLVECIVTKKNQRLKTHQPTISAENHKLGPVDFEERKCYI